MQAAIWASDVNDGGSLGSLLQRDWPLAPERLHVRGPQMCKLSFHVKYRPEANQRRYTLRNDPFRLSCILITGTDKEP